MLKYQAVLAACFVEIATSSSFANPYYPFGQPTGMAILHTMQKDANNNPQLYGGTTEGPPDNWHVYQWNDASEFGPFSYSKNTDTWAIGNGMAAVHWTPARGSTPPFISFAQNGQYLPCSNGEFDLGIEPNGWADAANPAMYPQAITSTPTLDKLAHYYISGTYTLTSLRYANQN